MSQSSASAFSYPAFPAHITWTDDAGNQNSMYFDLVQSEDWEEDATVTEHPVETGANVADHVRVELRTCTLKVWATNEPIGANNWDQATVTSTTLTVPGQVNRTIVAPDGQDIGVVGATTITVPTWDNPIRLRSIAGSLVGLVGGAVGGAIGGARAKLIAGDVSALVGIEAAFLLDAASSGTTDVTTDAGLEPSVGGTYTVQTQQWPGGSNGTDYVGKTIQALKDLKDAAQQFDVIGSKQICSPMVIEKLTVSRSSDTGTGADITIGFKELRVVQTQTVPVPIQNLSGNGGVPPQNKGSQDTGEAANPTKTVQSLANYLKNLPSGANPLSSVLSFLGGS